MEVFGLIQIYDAGNEQFSWNGNAVLVPSECKLTADLNGSWTLSMRHPLDDEGRWKHIEREAVIVADTFVGSRQRFRIRLYDKSDNGVTVTAVPIFFDSAKDCFLLDIRPTGCTGQEALNLMTNGSVYTASSNITTASTAYFIRRNLMDAINGDASPTFIGRWGGEIIYDNNRVIINSKVGADHGVEVRYRKNLRGISYKLDMSNVATRIVPLSFNGHMISGETPWVDSPYINHYEIIYYKEVAFEKVRFAEDATGEEGEIVCTTQAEMNAALMEQAENMFLAGADKPEVSLTVDLIALSLTDEYKDFQSLENIALGDTVHVSHTKLGITTEARAIHIEYDCITNKVVSVTLGSAEYNMFKDTRGFINRVSGSFRDDGTVMAEYVKGILNGMETQLRFQKSVAQKQDVRAILFEDTDEESDTYGALAIGTQGIEIAKEMLEDGSDWDWTTAITAAGINAGAGIFGLISDRRGRNYWNLDTGDFHLSAAAYVDENGEAVELGDYIAGTAVEAACQVVISLSNSYQAVPTDPDGVYASLSGCETDVTVMYGASDVTDLAVINITETGCDGTYNSNTHHYTVTSLTEDSGSVLFEATYRGLTSSMTLNIVKAKQGIAGLQGLQGQDGADGIPGTSVTITSTSVMYQAGDSATSAPTGTWSNSIVSANGRFLWTRTIVTYSDNTTTTSYSVSRQGIDGTDGTNGTNGRDGTNGTSTHPLPLVVTV